MACKFTELVIDSSDPKPLARFWADVLGYRVDKEGDDWSFIKGDEPGAPGIVFVTVPEKKTVKNRVHIDVNATDRDQAEEVARIESLGATRVDVGQRDVSWVVLADPEGNEFCVLRSRVD